MYKNPIKISIYFSYAFKNGNFDIHQFWIKASYAFQHSNFDTHNSVLDQLKSMISDIFVL